MTQSGCSDKAAPLQGEAAPVSGPSVSEGEANDPFMPLEQRAASGLSVEWIRFGAHLTSVTLPDGTSISGHLPSPENYAGEHPFVGSMIGRVANRIAGGRFEIDGQSYQVSTSDNGHALHGGPNGFGQQLWSATFEDDELVFRHTSPAGHQGYPGNLDVNLRSRLTDNELRLQIIAITDAPTPVNLTHHSYWDPSGLFDQPINELTLQSPADRFSAVDETLIPTSETPTVAGTAYDFRRARRIETTELDVNLFVPGDGLREMVSLSDGTRTITVLSDYPGLQIFTGESLGAVSGMIPRAGLALEPQYPPNAINQPVDGHDTILRPGEVYRHTILYRFDGPGFKDAGE